MRCVTRTDAPRVANCFYNSTVSVDVAHILKLKLASESPLPPLAAALLSEFEVLQVPAPALRCHGAKLEGGDRDSRSSSY
jgi:hypothetical protein